MRKADKKEEVASSIKLNPKEVVSKAFGISETQLKQFFEVLQNMDWSKIEIGEKVHSVISANIHTLSPKQQDCSGVLGKLRTPKPQEEFADVRLEEVRYAKTIISIRAALNSTISSNSNFSKTISDTERTVFSNLISVMASNNLSTIATSSESTTLSIGYQDIPESLEIMKSWRHVRSQRLSQQIREPVEEIVESFWNSTSDQEKVAILMKEKIESIYESLSTLAASLENEQVSKNLVKVTEDSGKIVVRCVSPRETVSSAFGISTSDFQQFFEALENMDWSQISLPVTEYSTISSNVCALAPPSFDCSNVLGKLRAPEAEEQSAEVKTLQAQRAQCVLDVKAAMNTTINTSDTFSKLPDDEKTAFSNLVGIMVTQDLRTVGTSSESQNIQVDYTDAKNNLEASKNLVAKNFSALHREVIQAAFGITSESVDQLLTLLEKVDWSQIELLQPVHSNISANIRGIAASSTQSSGVLGKLSHPKSEDESKTKTIRDMNTAQCVLHVMASLDSTITAEPSINRISEDERAVFSNIIGLMASNNLTTSSESSTSTFGFNNISELLEARHVMQQANQQSMIQKIRESSEELIQGIWNTANDQEKVAIVVKEKLETLNQNLKTLEIQLTTQAVNRELMGPEERLGIMKRVDLPVREVVSAAFSISNETVQNLLEVLTKVQWSDICLPLPEHQTISRNVRALAEPTFNCDSILGKLNSPEPQSERVDQIVTDKRKSAIVAQVKSVVENVISQDATFSVLPAEEQAVITNMAGLIVSNDIVSLCSSTSNFAYEELDDQESANIFMRSPNLQHLQQSVGQPTVQNTQGFWITSSPGVTTSTVIKEITSARQTLLTSAVKTNTQLTIKELSRPEERVGMLKTVSLPTSEFVSSAFGISKESVETLLEVLTKIEWSDIYLPQKEHKIVTSNVRALAEPTFNCESILGKLNAPEPHIAAADIVKLEQQKASVVANIKTAVSSIISTDTTISKLPEEEKANIIKMAELIVTKDLTALSSSHSLFDLQTTADKETSGINFRSPRMEHLIKHLREPIEQQVHGFWSTATDAEKQEVYLKEKVQTIHALLHTFSTSVVSESIYQNVLATVQSLTALRSIRLNPKEFVIQAFGISESKLDQFIEVIEKIDWSTIEIGEKEHSAISANIHTLSPEQKDCSGVLGKLRTPQPQDKYSDVKLEEVRHAKTILSIRAALSSTISSNSNFSKNISDTEKTVFSNLISVMASHKLSTIAPSSEAVDLSISHQESPESLGAEKSWRHVRSQRLSQQIREPVEEIVESFWNSTSDQEKVAILIKEKIESIYESLNTLAASLENEQVSKNLVKVTEDSGKIVVRCVSQRETVSSAFGISTSNFQQFFEALENMDWSQISLPVTEYSTISSNVCALAPPSFDCSNVLGKLRAPEAEEQSAEVKTLQAQRAQCVLDVKAAMNTTINTSDTFSKLPDDEKTAFSNLVGIMDESKTKTIRDMNTAQCVLHVMASLDATITSEPSINRISEDERAVFSNIIGLMASNNLTTSFESSTSTFGFNNISELLEARHVMLQANQQSMTQKIRESSEELIQGIWNTANDQEKVSIVVKEKLETLNQNLKTLEIQLTTQAVNRELMGPEERLGIIKRVDLPVREVVSAAFSISNETVQNLLEVLTKVQWSNICLPLPEHQTISRNVRALAEPTFNCDSILGKLNAPKPQSERVDRIVTDKRKSAIVAQVKFVVENVISQDATFSVLPAEEQAVITNMAGLIVSNDIVSLCSSNLNFAYEELDDQESANIFMRSPNLQHLQQRLREPIERHVQGFWSTATNAEKQEVFLREKIESIHASLHAFSSSLASESIHQTFMANSQSLAALRLIRLTPLEIICAAFGVSNKNLEQVFNSLDEVDWSQIQIPFAEKEALMANLQIVHAHAPNVFGSLMGRSEEAQGTSTVIADKQRVQFLLNLQKSIEQTISYTSSFHKSSAEEAAKISNAISLISSENLGNLIDQAVHLDHPSFSNEILRNIEIPRNVLLDRVLPETTEEYVQSFWKTSQLSDSTTSTVSEKLSVLKAEFVTSAAKQMRTSLNLEYRRKVFDQNSEIIFGELTKDVVCAAFSISTETLEQLFSYLEQADSSQFNLTPRQKIIIRENIASLARSNLEEVFKNLSKSEEFEATELTASEQQLLEIQNIFKIQQIVLDIALQNLRSEEKATFSNLIALLLSVNLKTAIQAAAFEREPDSLAAEASIIPVYKIQEHVRQPEEQIVEGFWSDEKSSQKCVEAMRRKIEVVKSMLTCYAAAENQKYIEENLERLEAREEAQVTSRIPHIVKDAFAVSDQTFFKILKVLDNIKDVEIPENVKEVLTKNLKILNLPPVETLLKLQEQKASADKTVQDQQLNQFLFKFKSALDSEIGIALEVERLPEKENTAVNNLFAILASSDLSAIVPKGEHFSKFETVFHVQRPDSSESSEVVYDDINILRHYLQAFSIQVTSTEVSKVLEIIRNLQSYHLVNTTMHEQIKTIKIRMDVLKRVVMNQATPEELLQEAFQSSEQQMETFQSVLENLHWEETRLTEEIIYNLKTNMSSIPRFEGTLENLKKSPKQRETSNTYIQMGRRAEAVMSLMTAAENAISTTTTLAMMESSERRLHKTILKTIAVCDLTTSASTSEQQTMTQGIYRHVDSLRSDEQIIDLIQEKIGVQAIESSEEAVHGIWSSKREKESSEKILKASELERTVLATLASQTEESSIYTELAAFGPMDQIEMLVAMELRDIAEQSFGISNQSLEKLFELIPKMDWSHLTMPIAQKDLVIRNLTMLVPAEVRILETVGTIQAPPEEEAFAELDLKQAREAKVMMDIQECVFHTCTGYSEMNRLHEAEATSFSTLLGTMSICDLVTMAASNIQIDSKYDYYRRPAPKDSELTFTRANSEATSIALREAGEVTSSGVWSTVSTSEAAKTTISEKMIIAYSTQMDTNASIEQVISQDQEFNKSSADNAELMVSESCQEASQQKYFIGQAQSKVEIQGVPAMEAFETKLDMPRTATLAHSTRSQSQKDLEFGGSFGELEPPRPEEEDAELIIRESRTYRSSSQIRAPSEESINRTEALRRTESGEFTSEKKFAARRRESVSLSRKASVQRETSVDAQVAKQGQSEPVEHLETVKTKQLTSFNVNESKELGVTGSWVTSKPPSGAKISIPSKKVEREITSATMTVASASIECDVGLEKEGSHRDNAIGTFVRAKSIEEVDREFGVEVTSINKDLEKREQIESWIKSMPDRVEAEENAEFGNDEVKIGGVMGTLNPPREQEEEMERLIEVKRLASEVKNLKTATVESVDEADEFSKAEADQGIHTVRKELITETSNLHTTATKQISATAKLQYSKTPSEDVTELSLTESRRQSNSGQFKESKEEEFVGLWKTGSKGELTTKILPHKPPIDIAALKAKAAQENVAGMSASLQKSPSAETFGVFKSKLTEETDSKFEIAQELSEAVIKSASSEKYGDASRNVIISNTGSIFGTVTEYSTKKTGVEFGASSLVSPAPEHDEVEHVQQVVPSLQATLTKKAAGASGASVESNINAPGYDDGNAHLLKRVASSEVVAMVTQASRNSVVNVETRQSRDDGVFEQSDLKLTASNLESQKLRLTESREEESALLIRSSNEYEETQKTLRHCSQSREATSKNLVAPSNQEIIVNVDRSAKEIFAEDTMCIGLVREASNSEVLKQIEGTSELRKRTLNEDVAGIRAVSETRTEVFRGRQQGDVEVKTGAAMGRIEAPRPQRGETEVTQKLKRNLSVERNLRASETVDSQITAQVQKKEDSLTSEYSVRSTLLIKSSSVSHIATEKMSDHLVSRSKSEHHISEKLQERLTEKENFSSQEFITENQGMHTHWDVIDNNGEALICWKSSEIESKSFDAKTSTETSSGTTLDLTVRIPGGKNEERVAEHVYVGIKEDLTISDTKADMEMTRQDNFRDDATYVASDVLEEHSLSTVHEFGESEASTTFGIGKLVSKKPQKEDIDFSISETRLIQKTSTITAVSETSMEMDSEILRLPECDQSAKLISHNAQQNETKNLKASVEISAAEEAVLEKREVREQSVDVKKVAKRSIQDSKRLSEPRNENALSQYSSDIVDLEEKTVIPLTRNDSTSAVLRASQTNRADREISIDRGEANRMASKNVPMRAFSRASEERRFQIQMTKSEKMLAKEDSVDESEFVTTISLRDEITSEKFREFGNASVEVCTLFGKIVQKKFELEDIEEILPMVRRWAEVLSMKASTSVEIQVDNKITKEEAERSIQKKLKTANSENHQISVKSTHEEVMTATSVFESRKTRDDVAAIQIRDKSRERVEKKYQENQWNLLSTNAEWETLLNDLEESVTIAQSVQDSMAFSAKAAASVNFTKEANIKREEATIGIQKSISQSNIDKTFGKYSSATIENELLVTKLGMNLEEIEQLVDEINREQAVGGRIKEFGRSETGGGIYLVRRALPKIKETSTHTVTLATSFRQIFSTMSAGDEISEANVELTIPSASVEAEIKNCVARSDSMTFSTAHASEHTATTVADYARDIAVSASTAARKKAIPVEKSTHKLKEVGSDGVEILSLWEGVETDLDASTQLVHLLKVKSSFQTIESTEEVERINQYLEMPEEKGLVIHLICVQNKDSCFRNFAVSSCSLDTAHSRTFEISPTYFVSKVLTEKRVVRETWRVIESGDVRFNAVINLHRYSLSKPTLAQETVLREVVWIEAQPLFISAGDIESDVVWCTHQLQKISVVETTNRTIVGARKGEGVKKKLEESGDEKVKLKIDLIGGNPQSEAYEKLWNVPRSGEKVKFETEEFEYDECLFYGQINCKRTHFEDKDYSIKIPRLISLNLATIATSEENKEVSETWTIPEKTETADKLVIIGNVGTPIYFRTKESSEDIVGVGIAYNIPEEKLVSATKLKEKAFGGSYELNTKAAGDEYKIISSSLSNAQSVEKVKGKMIQRVTAKSEISVFETTTEVINANFNYVIPEENLKVGTLKTCANNATPFTLRLHECLEFYIKMFYNMNKKDDFEYFTKTFIIPDTITPKTLECAAAELIETTRNPEFSRSSEFYELKNTVIDSNKIEGTCLNTFEPTSDKMTLGTMLNRQEEASRVEHIVKTKNKGANLKFKCMESREQKQTVYNSFEVEEQKDKIERTIDLVRQGGYFKLSTDAAEENEINLHRELSKPLITHHDTLHLITLFNTAPHQSLSTMEARRELQTVSERLSKPFEWLSAELLVVAKNVGQSVKWRVLECEECVENVHPIYRKPADHFDLDDVWYIARNGGKFEQRLKASREEREVVEEEIKSRGIKDDRIDKKFVVGNKGEPISLTTIQTSSIVSTISQDMSKLGEKESVKKIIRHSNKGINVEKSMIEATEYKETINEQFRKSDQFDVANLLIQDKRNGGAYELSSYAAQTSSSSISSTLLCPRPSELSTAKTFVTAQTIIPSKLECKATETVGHIVNEAWNKPNEYFATSKTITDCNKENEQFTFRESGEEYHTTNCFYSREQEDKTVAETLHEARRTGGQNLFTKHATDRSMEAVQHFEKVRLAEASSGKLFVIGNVAEPSSLSTSASGNVQHSQIVDLNRSSPYEVVEILKQGANLGIPAYLHARETTSKTENVATQYIRKEDKEEIGTIKKTPLLAEPVIFDSNASMSHSISLDKSFNASGDFELDAVVVIVDRNTEQPQFFRCSCTKEASTSAAASLSAGSKSETCRSVRVSANRGQPATLAVRESRSVQETNNVHYQRDEHHDHVSETRAYPRYGGKFSLDSKTSTEESVRLDKDLEKKSDKHLETDKLIIIRNEEGPLEIFVSATEESAAGVTTSLSRNNPYESTNTTITAPNKGEPVYSKIKETQEHIETNNVQLRREEEHEEQIKVVKIAAYGGSSILRSGFADEKFVDSETKLLRKDEFETTHIVRTISNEDKSNLSIGASQETSVNLDETVVCKKSSFEEAFITKETKNVEPHVIFRSTEASDMAVGIHYTLRSSEKIDETEEIKKIARNGGSSTFSCFAAGDSSPDSVSAYLTRESEEGTAERLFPTPMIDSLKFNSTAAEEFAVWNTTSFRRKDNDEEFDKVFSTSGSGENITFSSKASEEENVTLDADLHFGVGYKEHRQVTKDDVNVGEGTGMHSGASEETIFNLGYDYCKQPTEFTTVCVTEDKLLIQGAYGFRAVKEESITLDADLHFGISQNDLRAMRLHASNNEIDGTGMRSTASEETVFNLAYDYCKQPTEFRTVFVSEDHQLMHGAFGFRAVGEEHIETQVLELEARMVEVMVEGSVHNLARRHEDEPFVLYTEVIAETVIRVDERIEKKTTVVESEQASEVKMREKVEERRKEEKRVSFAAEVQEKNIEAIDKSLGLDTSMELRNVPVLKWQVLKHPRILGILGSRVVQSHCHESTST
uniref:Uncharacterized protein n=2 Tax=Caenorhabditis japonica TaxID=281687 RepID=A0A8R1DM55_CAEJA